MMSEERLKEIRRIEAKATMGPLSVGGSLGRWVYDAHENYLAEFEMRADRDFFIAARSAVPELLAEVDRLKAELKDARETYHHLRESLR